MSESVDKMPPQRPPPQCPMCAGATRLKEVLRHRNGLHYSFRCVVCEVIIPVVELLRGPQPS